MEANHLCALRLGFSTADASSIQKMGIFGYVEKQLSGKNKLSEPAFLANTPRSLMELNQMRKVAQKDKENAKSAAINLTRAGFEWKSFLVERMYQSSVPLREKINLFFQNHFVVTLQSVKIPYWIYGHYATINEHALGNYKTLVHEMVYSNAMIKYLDNQQNRKGKINENLARELLELFTLGEGHYTESDIKNAALVLAGLSFGSEKGMYRPRYTDHSSKTLFGKSGNFHANELIDLIFEQHNTPYFLAEKALKWFFYDQPEHSLVTYYGDYLKNQDFELKPFFVHMLTRECEKLQAGTQMKSPLTFVCQVFNDLQLEPHYPLMVLLLKNQGMDLYDQPNVKGWPGGQDWLSTHIYTQRKQFIDFVAAGNKRFELALNRRLENAGKPALNLHPVIDIKNNDAASDILLELKARTVFQSDEAMDEALAQVIRYDFDPHAANAREVLLRAYQFLAKTPEFQIV